MVSTLSDIFPVNVVIVVEFVRKHYGFDDEDQNDRERIKYVTTVQTKSK